MPVCPGCHIGCEIENYQCGRGEAFCVRWHETGELPERRLPGPPPASGAHAMPTDMRLMHMLGIIPIALNDLTDECMSSASGRRFAECIMRHGKAASASVMQERTHLDADEIENVAHILEDEGLACRRTAENGVVLFELTDEGRSQAKSWHEERKAAESNFLSPLDDAEKEELHNLIVKLLEPGFKRLREQAEKKPAAEKQ